MRWQRGHRSEHVEVRGGRGGGGAGALGLLLPLVRRLGLPGVLIVIALFAGQYFCGDQLGLFGGDSKPGEVDDEAVSFVSFVLDDAQETFAGELRDAGQRYRPAKLVVFRGATSTGCGHGSAAVGPFYCPRDGTIYIDLGFYDELRRRFGAPGDFAQAYVIAHEVGHHLQALTGKLGGARGSGRDSESVRTELQADCLAGVWARSTQRRELLEAGDVEEALGAAAAIGDDTLQRRSGTAVQPESWTHGSSAQRVAAFRKGMDGGTLASCGL